MVLDIQRLKYIGEFDQIKIQGYVDLCYKQRGIEIKESNKFFDILKDTEIGNLIDAYRIEIIGESNLDEWNQSEILRQRENRKLYGIQPIQIGKSNVDRYIIGYITILVIDTQKINMKDLLDSQSLIRLDNGQNEIETMQFIQNYCSKLQKQLKFNRKPICIGLIDRMYVGRAFRGNGVGGWIIDNLKELIEFYSKQSIDTIMLEPGDFANEQENYFKMQRQKYVNEYLQGFYKQHGFKKYKQNKAESLIENNKYMIKTY